MITQLSNCSFYEGDVLKKNKDIIIRNGMITEIKDSVSGSITENLVVPGFIDLQIYGAAGKLFSAEPSIGSLSIIEDALLKDGTTSFFACIATNTPEVFNQCIEAAKMHRKTARNCMGLHLEGPFLNAKRRGAHVKEYVRKASLDEIKALLDFGDGVIKMMTLAPELQDDEVIQYLLDHQVVVSLGHSDATFDQATAAYNKGIQTTTHLFNAMSPLHHRDPGIPTAVFNHPSAMASIIADGSHVDFEVIKMSQKLMNDRLFLITDAVTTCSVGPYQHQLQGDKFITADGTLSGSNITMLQAVLNCVNACDIPLPIALQMAALYPAKLIGQAQMKGKIDVGYRADLLVLDKFLKLEEIIFQGDKVIPTFSA